MLVSLSRSVAYLITDCFVVAMAAEPLLAETSDAAPDTVLKNLQVAVNESRAKASKAKAPTKPQAKAATKPKAKPKAKDATKPKAKPKAKTTKEAETNKRAKTSKAGFKKIYGPVV